MFRNYMKIALRNLVREKGYAFINIGGLTIGIASCILILIYITNELTYDRHNEKSDRIYRAGIEAVFGDSHFFSAYTSDVMKDALEYEFSEVEESVRLVSGNMTVVKLDNQSFIEEKFFYSDPNFFRVFTVPLITGDPQTVLSRPNTVVISMTAASKYFGKENPVGKTILVNEKYEMEITGVSSDIPSNSHFRFEFLGSIQTIKPENNPYWTSNNLYTYVLLVPGTSITDFGIKLQELVYKYVGPEVEKIMGINIDAFEESGGVYSFFLEALPDIHMHSKTDNQLEPGGNMTYIYFFSIIAAFLLLIACINFMNMATARYTNRAKEVGVRKVVGSTRGQLIQQFLTESVLTSIAAIILAMTIVELILPWFNFLTSKSLEIAYLDKWYFIPLIIFFALFTGVLSGSYPAFFLSSFQPVKILKGGVTSGMKSNRLRKALVVLQFTITIALLVSTFIVSTQLNYWQSHDQGYKKDGLFIAKRVHVLGERQDAFREELMKHRGILNVSFSSSVPGYDFEGTSLHELGKPSEELVQTALIYTDEYYLETLGMEMAEGRFFSSDYGTDNEAVVINETFANVMSLENATTKSIVFPHRNMITPVIGVLKNVNFESLHQNIRPLTIKKLDSPAYLMTVRMENENIPAVIASIENMWKDFAGDAPFVWSFLEEDLLELYNQDIRTGYIFSIFSLLAIFIACLGLFGMASFTAEKRTKEIGIRKAMGASLGSIYMLLIKEVIILVLFATVISWPVAWYVMNSWLENFAYSIKPGLTAFILSTLFAFIIAIFTVSYQSRKAAIANPVDSLKYE